MNKIYLWGFITVVVMGALTYFSVLGSKGGLNDDMFNILTVASAIALVLITVFVVIKYVRQMQTDKAEGELDKVTWDEIGEYHNPYPTGMSISFILVLLWGWWYFLIGYPPQSFSQIGEYNEEVAKLNAKFEKKYASIQGDELIEMGESVFLAECKICHGLTADGIDGTAANLTVRLEENIVKHVIENGSNFKLMGAEVPMPDRHNIMNGNKDYAPITDAEIDAVAKYVANGMSGDAEAKDAYLGSCAACHGEDGKGNGAGPNIATYDTALVVNVLNHGKKGPIGVMPAFDRLNTKQKEAVAAYVSSLVNN